VNENRTKLNMRPGQKARLVIEANAPIEEGSQQWRNTSGIVQIDESAAKSAFDVLIIAASIGIAIVEFAAIDAGGEKILEHVFEITVEGQPATDADLIGHAAIEDAVQPAGDGSVTGKPDVPALPADGPLAAVKTDPEPANNLGAAGADLANTPGGGFNTGAEASGVDTNTEGEEISRVEVPVGDPPADDATAGQMAGVADDATRVGACTQCDVEEPHQHIDENAPNFIEPVKKDEETDLQEPNNAPLGEAEAATGSDEAGAGEDPTLDGPTGAVGGDTPGNDPIEPEGAAAPGQPAGETVVANDDGPSDQAKDVTSVNGPQGDPADVQVKDDAPGSLPGGLSQ
jgi:hypothetical protein